MFHFRIGLGVVYATQEKFENGDFTLETIRCFPSTLRRRSMKTQQFTGHFGFVWHGEYHDYNNVVMYQKLRFQNAFRPR